MMNYTAIAEGIREAQESAKKSIREAIFPELYKQWAEKLAGLAPVDPVELVTPLNANMMRIIWMNGENVFPEFEYDDNALMTASYQATKIKNLGPLGMASRTHADKVMLKILADRYNMALAKTELAEGIISYDAHKARHAAAKLYGELDTTIVELAENHAQTLAKTHGAEQQKKGELSSDEVERLRKKQFDSMAIREAFLWALNEYGLSDWAVEISDTTQYIAVHPRRVVIPEDKIVDGLELAKLIGHEIECHARDMANGLALFGELGGGMLRASDGIMAEGHAKLSDMRFEEKYLGKKQRLPIPWYVFAINRAMEGVGFNRVARELEFYLSNIESETKARKDAWKYTYRVFRGSQDTHPARGHQNVFVFTKDKCYFEGYIFAKALADNGLEHWLEIGLFRPEELLDIASIIRITEDDIPYQNRELTDVVIKEL